MSSTRGSPITKNLGAEKAEPTSAEEDLEKLRKAHTRQVGYQPNRSIMVCGRPVMALVLTHEAVPANQMDTYLWQHLSPIRPILSFGRSAKTRPCSDARVCVYHWWQDLCADMCVR